MLPFWTKQNEDWKIALNRVARLCSGKLKGSKACILSKFLLIQKAKQKAGSWLCVRRGRKKERKRKADTARWGEEMGELGLCGAGEKEKQRGKMGKEENDKVGVRREVEMGNGCSGKYGERRRNVKKELDKTTKLVSGGEI